MMRAISRSPCKRDGGADLDWSLRPNAASRFAFALVAGGEHNQAAWKRMLPEFLRWAYGRAAGRAIAARARPATDPTAVRGALRTQESSGFLCMNRMNTYAGTHCAGCDTRLPWPREKSVKAATACTRRNLQLMGSE